jgi:hypothetical protein
MTMHWIDRDEIGEAFVNLTRVSLISSERKWHLRKQPIAHH